MDPWWGGPERSSKGTPKPSYREGFINPDCVRPHPGTHSPNTCFGELAPWRCWARWVPVQAGSGHFWAPLETCRCPGPKRQGSAGPQAEQGDLVSTEE